ncbi:CarD family transcriptional regulator [Mesobacillus jeotgali]|uniref:CarD family transcriptional regulator n=1 Tax=Mesobacillus jeotgali TaxID=129985 RepID=UPI0009A7FD63|nr:CarD family transcriptional regulator [Mesobacillus jeotgali]
MFNIGDLVIYSAHGICKIDDICEKTVLGVTRPYYVLHPTDNNHQLTLSVPVHSDKVSLHEMVHKEDAQEILDSFKYPGIDWVDKPNVRQNLYSGIVNRGDRMEIARTINTLMRKKIEADQNEKKLYEQDRKLLNTIQSILFKELAIAFNTSVDRIEERITKYLLDSNKEKVVN